MSLWGLCFIVVACFTVYPLTGAFLVSSLLWLTAYAVLGVLTPAQWIIIYALIYFLIAAVYRWMGILE